jgi:hypothetical protein
MRNVDVTADAIGQSKSDPLPERVQEALGELAGAAKEGLLALSVGVGLGVLAELMDEEVDGVVGPKGRHDAGRRGPGTAVRPGRSRSVGAACPSSVRGCGPPTAPGRSRWRPTRTSPTVTR